MVYPTGLTAPDGRRDWQAMFRTMHQFDIEEFKKIKNVKISFEVEE